MVTVRMDEQSTRTALELASRAPSVHNSQPWRWRLGDSSLHLYADLRRWLPATDTDGRDLVLSCGAALHHLRVALSSLDLAPVTRRIPNSDEPDHLAAIELHQGCTCDADLRLASAITRRRTDRRRFTNRPLPKEFRQALIQQAADQGAVLRAIDEPKARRELLAVIRDAAAAQEASPEYQTEIALWSARRADFDGVPAANIPRRNSGEPVLRRFRAGELEQVAADDDGALLFVLGTASDDPLSQLRAGEAMSAVLLHATELGLATSPLSQPLEIDTARRILRDQVLDGTLTPELVIRMGWAPTGEPPPPFTPRRPLDEQLERIAAE